MNFSSRAFRKIFFAKKSIYQLFACSKDSADILYISGCQRSGTTLMTEIFKLDLRSKVYTAFSELSSKDPEKIRLNPLPDVERHISKDRASLIVMKPLVESQNLLNMLEYFPNSKALWMFRHYKDVSSSNIVKFGVQNGIRDIEPIVNKENGNWRSETVSDFTREIISKYFSKDMNPFDAAALFWFSRNRIFVELDFADNPRVFLCKYDDLVQSPSIMMPQVYQAIGHKYPGDRIVKHVHNKSIGKGRAVELSPSIEALCAELYHQLDRCYRAQRRQELDGIYTNLIER